MDKAKPDILERLGEVAVNCDWGGIYPEVTKVAQAAATEIQQLREQVTQLERAGTIMAREADAALEAKDKELAAVHAELRERETAQDELRRWSP